MHIENLLNMAPEGYAIYICIALLGIGFFLLAQGGGFLVDGGIGLAESLKIKTVVIGLTILAFSTSAPELAFNIFAGIDGHGEVVLGNVFGSNVANLALVLGIGALVHNYTRKKSGESNAKTQIPAKVLKLNRSWLRWSTGLVAATVLFSILSSRVWPSAARLFSWQLGLVGIFFFVIFFKRVMVAGKGEEEEEEEEAGSEIEKEPLGFSAVKSIVYICFGMLLLLAGGKIAEVGAIGIAMKMGISEMFVGFTIVAIATSLPELVTTIVACRKDEGGIAIGNIVGSNIFNLLFVLPITMVVVGFAPIELNYLKISGISEPIFYVLSMVAITWIARRMMHEDKDINNKEAKLLLCIYALFLVIAGFFITT